MSSDKKTRSAYVTPITERLKRSGKRNIEPHVILHLRITEEDIETYLNQKIQTDPLSITQLSRTPAAYEPIDSGCGSYASWESVPQYTPDTSLQTFSHPTNTMGHNQTMCSDSTLFNLDVSNVSLDLHPNVPTAEPEEEEQSSDVKFRILDAMVEFADANRRKEWPHSTSIWCRWCCSPFTGPPVSIPRWYINETFFVYGCYCSYSCAAAHLFNRGDITEDDKWESYNLLHLLRKRILGVNETKKIPLAGPQELLQKFGGPLPIKEFRDLNKETHTHHRVFKVLYPPMISIVPKIEENTFSTENEDMRLLQTPGGVRAYGKMKYVAPKNENYQSRTRWGKDQPFIPVDQERVKKAIENLKVKRSKPLLDKKHTLFNYMKLNITKRKEQT